MSINKRAFGTPIKGVVRAQLEERQKYQYELGAPKQVTFGQTIQGAGGADGKIPKSTEHSSRTPFVRMWTALKLIDPEILADAQITELTTEEAASPEEIQELIEKANKTKKDPLGVEYESPQVNEIRDNDGNLIKIVIREEGTRDKVDFARKIYIIGDHGYQESYGQVNTNDSLTSSNVDAQASSDFEDKLSSEGILTQELATNPLFKPQSGITSLSSETQGSYGSIKKTVVNFTVHNFYDFDRIYNQYFLKPGAQVFVDFGWTTVGRDLYNPQQLINSINAPGGIQEFLYAESEYDATTDTYSEPGVVTANQGNLDVIQGLVTDYNAKILPNGSVECSVTITSSNSAILNFVVTDDFQYRIKKILTNGVLFYGLTGYLRDLEFFVPGASDGKLAEFLRTPNAGVDTDYDNRLEKEAQKALGKTTTPSGHAIRQGVFMDGADANDTYICWGLVEDLIFNTQFGFGKNKDDISQGEGFQIRMDSSQSTTTWSQTVRSAQITIQNTTGESSPVFLYPDWWGDFDPECGGDSQKTGGAVILDSNGKTFTAGSYNSYHKENKQPPRAQIGANLVQAKKQQIIPLRDVFIHTEIIDDAFSNETKVIKVINLILQSINDESGGLFKWTLIGGDLDSQLKVIDLNMVEAEQLEKYTSFESEDEKQKTFFNFNIMDKHSMVKDYNLELKLPSDSIANYYALQGLSHDSSLYSVNKNIQGELNSLYGLDAKQLSIIYEPDNGDYRAQQLVQNQKDPEAFNVYNTIASLTTQEIVTGALPGSNAVPTPKKKTKGKSKKTKAFSLEVDLAAIDAQVKKNEDAEKLAGRTLSFSISGFFQDQIFEKDVEPEKSTLMPYYLTLTIHGISGIIPGDTFTVDYLPQAHLKGSYLQTMQITHQVDSSGWYTTLETQYRNNFIKKPKKLASKPTVDSTNIRLSPRAFLSQKLNQGRSNFNIKERREVDKMYDMDMNYVLPYMTDIKVKPNIFRGGKQTFLPGGGIAYSINEDLPGILIEFKTPKTIDDTILKNLKGITYQSLYAEFGLADGSDIDLNLWNSGTNILKQGEWDSMEGRSGNVVGKGYNSSFNAESSKSPFLYSNDKVYKKIAKDIKSVPFVKGSHGQRIEETRIYPPSVRWELNTFYVMLVVDNNYAILKKSWSGDRTLYPRYLDTELNSMIKFFSTIGTELK